MSSEATVPGSTAAETPSHAAAPNLDGAICIGDRAVAASTLLPGGIVTIHGRRHSARLTATVGNMAEPGAELVVVGGDNAGFIVRPVTAVQTVELSRRGEPVHGSFGAAIQSDARRAERGRAIFERTRVNKLRVSGLAAGVGTGLIAVALCWLWPSISWPGEAWQVATLVIGAPLAFGLTAVWLARQLDRQFAETDTNLRGLSIPTTALMLLGAAVGGAWGIPRLGLLSGVGLAAVAALVLGSPLPAIFMVVAAGAEEGGLEGIGAGSEGRGGAGEGAA